MSDSKVDSKSAAVRSMSDGWLLVDDLLGGTTAMRKALRRRMPQFPNEPDEVYTKRVEVSTLLPAFAKTCSNLAARPFSRPVALSDDMPPKQKEWCDNVDRQGRNIARFCGELLELSIAYGQCHVFVDYPVNPGAVTIAQEQQLGLRPYFVLVKAPQVLGWRATEQGVLTQVRFLEKVQEPDGDFGEKDVEQIRVLEIGKWSVWRKTKDVTTGTDSWSVYASGSTTMNVVPFFTVYAGRIDYMVSRPPLIELAHLNVKHWQSQSDQDNILHIARVPILKAIGVDDHFTLTVGTQAAVKLPPGADLAFTEHSGASIGAGQASLFELKEEMRLAGAELLVPKPGPKTATEISTDAQSNMSDLQRVVQDLQDGINLGLEYMAKWAKLPKAGTVTIFNEFVIIGSAGETTANVLAANTAGILSKETAFSEMKRRGVIDAELDWDEEKERMEDEGPPVGKLDPSTGLPYDKPAPPPDPNAPPTKTSQPGAAS